VVDGVECQHLAFRGRNTDRHPRKYVITSKAMAGAPEYTVVLRNWKTDVERSADAFVFTPRAGARKLDFKALSRLDEIPPETGSGGQK
jgi:hypothetical protein